MGEFARNHGGKVPGRLVNSAKSWLCHDAVDRTAKILPWGAEHMEQACSPVEASTPEILPVSGWPPRQLSRLQKLFNSSIGK